MLFHDSQTIPETQWHNPAETMGESSTRKLSCIVAGVVASESLISLKRGFFSRLWEKRIAENASETVVKVSGRANCGIIEEI